MLQSHLAGAPNNDVLEILVHAMVDLWPQVGLQTPREEGKLAVICHRTLSATALAVMLQHPIL